MFRILFLIALTICICSQKAKAGWKPPLPEVKAPPVGGFQVLPKEEQNQIVADWQYVLFLANQLCRCDETLFVASIDRTDKRVKAAAALVAHKYQEKYVTELVDLISDDNLLVSQCARYSLVQISNLYLGGRNFVDFGPLAIHGEETKNSVGLLWKVWFEKTMREKQKIVPQQQKTSPQQKSNSQSKK